jgi:hypothetical protein
VNTRDRRVLLQAIASSPEVVSAPEQASVLRLLPIALIGGILEGLSLSSFLNNSQNSILFGLREIYVSIVVRDVDDDIERLGPCSSWPLTDCCQFYILQSDPGWLRVSWENEREQCVQHGGFETVGGSWH